MNVITPGHATHWVSSAQVLVMRLWRPNGGRKEIDSVAKTDPDQPDLETINKIIREAFPGVPKHIIYQGLSVI